MLVSTADMSSTWSSLDRPIVQGYPDGCQHRLQILLRLRPHEGASALVCHLLPEVMLLVCSHKRVESEEDMHQAMQMLAELRRTESTPNVEAEALKRNKGGGGPWMSFTRQRRAPKPRSAKKGGGSPSAGGRRGSPLATVVSVDAEARRTMAGVAADAAAGTSPSGRTDHSGAAERHSHKK